MGFWATTSELLWAIVSSWLLWFGLVPASQLAFLYRLARPWLIRRWPWFARRAMNRQQRRAAKAQTQRRWPQLALLSATGLLAALLITTTVVYHDMRAEQEARLADALGSIEARDKTIAARDDEIGDLKREMDNALADKEREIAAATGEIARLHQQMDDRTHRAAKRELLGNLMASGRDLWDRGARLDDQGPEWDSWKKEQRKWGSGVIEAVRQNFSQEEVELVLGPVPENCRGVFIDRGDEYAGAMNWVCAIRTNLQKLSDTYRD